MSCGWIQTPLWPQPQSRDSQGLLPELGQTANILQRRGCVCVFCWVSVGEYFVSLFGCLSVYRIISVHACHVFVARALKSPPSIVCDEVVLNDPIPRVARAMQDA